MAVKVITGCDGLVRDEMDEEIRSVLALLRDRAEDGTRSGALRIGITGHRWNKIDRSRTGALDAMMRRTLAQIDGMVPGPKMLVCGMAEGTDLVTALARPDTWTLEAVLPLPADDWRKHLHHSSAEEDAEAFDRAMHGAEVMTLPHPEGPDYVALAHHLVDSCDLLIAVWDGLSPKPGGTGEVVDRARSRGMPVLILPPPGSDQPG